MLFRSALHHLLAKLLKIISNQWWDHCANNVCRGNDEAVSFKAIFNQQSIEKIPLSDRIKYQKEDYAVFVISLLPFIVLGSESNKSFTER